MTTSHVHGSLVTGIVDALVVWAVVSLVVAAVALPVSIILAYPLFSYPPSLRWVLAIPGWAVADGPVAALRRAGRTALAGTVAHWHWLRAPIAGADSLPDQGVVAVQGTVTTADGTVAAPATGQECLAYGCAVYDAASSRDLLSPGTTEGRWVREVGEAVPFAVVDEGASVVVDAVPVDLTELAGAADGAGVDDAEAGTEPDWTPPRGLSNHDTVLLPAGMDPDGAVRDRLADLFDGTDLRVGRDRVRIHEWRLEPGMEVTVLGQRVDDVAAPDRDLLNLAGSRQPFAVASRTAGAERTRLPLLVLLAGGVVIPALVGAFGAAVWWLP